MNDCLQAQFVKIDELYAGAAYCQFVDMYFPGTEDIMQKKYIIYIIQTNINKSVCLFDLEFFRT